MNMDYQHQQMNNINANILFDKGIGYGIEAKRIDGNNILEVYSIIKELR